MTYEQAMKKVRDGAMVWEPTMNSRWYILLVGETPAQESSTGAQLPWLPTKQQKESDRWQVRK